MKVISANIHVLLWKEMRADLVGQLSTTTDWDVRLKVGYVVKEAIEDEALEL
jgi:hypothetical protein